MDGQRRLAGMIIGLMGLVAIVLSAVALYQHHRLSLPEPTAIAVLNIITPVIALLFVLSRGSIAEPVGAWTRRVVSRIMPSSIFLPFTLFILSLVYGIPSDMFRCNNETQWSRLFRARNEAAIRTIESSLRCCGYNSVRDRAWPFPSRDVNANACVETFGYTVSCVDVWRRLQSFTAGLLACSSLLNFLILLAAGRLRPYEGQISLSDRRPHRLLSSQTEQQREQQGRSHPTSYRDDEINVERGGGDGEGDNAETAGH